MPESKGKKKPTEAQRLAQERAELEELQACIEEERQVITTQKAQVSTLSHQEQAFMLYHLSGMNKTQAMKQAGFIMKHDRSLIWRANRIIARHDSLVSDKRRIFREAGATELAVAQGLINLALHALSEAVRLNAWDLIAKVLGLTREQVEAAPGIQILITGADQVQIGQADSAGTPTAIGVEPIKVRMIK